MSQPDVEKRAFRRYLLVGGGMGAAIIYGGLTRLLFGQQLEFL